MTLQMGGEGKNLKLRHLNDTSRHLAIKMNLHVQQLWDRFKISESGAEIGEARSLGSILLVKRNQF